MILLANILIIQGAIAMLFNNYWSILYGRLLYGAGGGLMTIFVPKFISELAPPEYSGPLGIINQIMCTVGLFTVPIISLPSPSSTYKWTPEMADDFNIAGWWRIVFAWPILIAIIQVSLLMTCFKYDSPSYLKQTGQLDALSALMNKIYDSRQVADRIASISVADESSSQN